MSKDAKTILITGGAGFIGSHLCEYYLIRGFRVICLDNFLTGSRRNIKHLLPNRRFRLIKHDISKPFWLRGAIDSVFHFASPASPPDYLKHPIKTMKVGSLGTHNTLGLAKAKRARYILASTSEVYGDPAVHPQVESYWGHVNPVGPRGVYDEAKRFGEALALAYHREHHVRVRIARIFNTYGPRMRAHDGRVIPNFIDQALRNRPITIYGKGKQTRSFCFVDDLVKGIAALRLAKEPGPFNLGNPNEYNMIQLARVILKLTKSRARLVFKPLPIDDPRRRCPNIDKAKHQLKWQPHIRLEVGLKSTIDYFQRLRSR